MDLLKVVELSVKLKDLQLAWQLALEMEGLMELL